MSINVLHSGFVHSDFHLSIKKIDKNEFFLGFVLRKNTSLDFLLTKDDSNHSFSHAKDRSRP